MAGEAKVRTPNELWGARLLENLRRSSVPPGDAGLGDDLPPKRRLNLSFPPEINDAPDAGLNSTPQPATGPRVASPSKPAPNAKIKAADVRREFDNLTFWDSITKNPEWERGVQGVGEIRAAEGVRAAKPDTMKADADRAELDAQALDAEADRLRKAGKISEAKVKTDAAYAKRQEAMEAAWAKAKINEVDEAKKKAADWIKGSKKKKAEAFELKKKGLIKGGALAAGGLALGYFGNKMMEEWQENQNASAENVAANEIMNRILEGGQTTPEEDALVIEKLGSEDALLKLKGQAGAAAPPPGAPPGAPVVAPEAAPAPMQPTRAPGPPLRVPEAGLVDVAYRPGAEKPEVAEVPQTYDPAVHAAILADPEGGVEHAREYVDYTSAEDLRRRANALTDAGIENTAAAAGMPDGVMDYLREQGEYSRAEDAGEAPVSDNWWNRNIAGPIGEAQARRDEFYSDPANRTGLVYGIYDSLPSWAQGGVDAADTIFNPFTIAQNVLGTTTDEAKALPYQIGRNTILGPGAFTGLNDEAFGPVYSEAMRSMGGETLGPDPIAAPIVEGAAPIYGPTDMSDMGGGMGSGTGTYDTGMPNMEDLAALERIGALGTNPDGSNMTVAQYIQKGNMVGQGMEPELPMFGGSPMPAYRGPFFPDDPRLGPMPTPVLPQLPAAPSDMPIVQRLQSEIPSPPGMPRSFIDDNARDFRRADIEWNKMATMLGLTPTGEPIRGRTPAVDAGATRVAPGGQGDQYAGSFNPFGPAMAGTMPQDQEEIDAVADDLIRQDEVAHPKGQTDDIGREDPKPQKTWWEWLTYQDPSGEGAAAPSAPAEPTPVLADGGLAPSGGGLSMGAPVSTGSAPASSGAVGDFNAARTAAKDQGSAGLADDAAAADEQLNWINRQLRDRMGMDASQRAKAAEALISFGSTVLASRGDDWQAIGEGLQAGYGTVSQMNDEQAASAAAAQEAALEESRWQQEMALKRLRGEGGEGGNPPDKIEQIQYLMAMAKIANPNISEAEAYQQALERVYSSDGLAALMGMAQQ